MADKSAIEWTGATWNPVVGCTKVDAACGHCYIERTPRLRILGMRFERKGNESTTGLRFFEHMLDPDYVRKLRPRDEPIFVCSLSDLFHEDVPNWFIHNVFKVMHECPERTFQVLTKRPERLLEWYRGERDHFIGGTAKFDQDWPLPNVWLGTSIGTARYTWRADVLREIPAAVRFISAEPLLGSLFPYDRRHDDGARLDHSRRGGSGSESSDDDGARGTQPDASTAERSGGRGRALDRLATSADRRAIDARLRRDPDVELRKPLDLTGIDWLIVGGESGPNFRPLNLDHARELRDACLSACGAGCEDEGDVEEGCERRPAFFFKQVGGRTPKSGGREIDGREWNEMPVREAVAA